MRPLVSRTNSCTLCYQPATVDFFRCEKTLFQYKSCPECGLIFVPETQHLDARNERAVYDQHNNDPEDLRYRKHLNRLAEPIIARLASRYAKGLDFGSGPGPAMQLIFECAGHECAIYDKFYANDKTVLTNKAYDFISSSEVVEHLSNPGATFQLLFSLLGPNGILGVMTKLYSKNQDFGNWYYKNDPTHIAFYTEETMRFIAKANNKKALILGPDIILFI